MKIILYVILLSSLSSSTFAAMRMGEWGMVMNENSEQLPQGCASIAGEDSLLIKAGREYAKEFPGTIFGYNQHAFSYPKCTRIKVTFINEDDIRHQFMIHGLPSYLHPQGMFHMELYGRGEVSGTFITPNTEKTYLAHCDIAQHTEKGMKAQVMVGGGSGHLPSIPGVSGQLNRDEYEFDLEFQNILLLIVLLALGFSCSVFFFIWHKK